MARGKGACGEEKREAFDLEKRCCGRFYNVIVEVAKLCSFFLLASFFNVSRLLANSLLLLLGCSTKLSV